MKYESADGFMTAVADIDADLGDMIRGGTLQIDIAYTAEGDAQARVRRFTVTGNRVDLVNLLGEAEVARREMLAAAEVMEVE